MSTNGDPAGHEGRIRTTVAEVIRPINAENLRRAHAFIETGRARGKIVLEGFQES